MKTTNEPKYYSQYKCPACPATWEGVWDSGCDEECPECGTGSITPHTTRLVLTPEEFAARVVANVKTQRWLNETVQVNGEPVGIKAYGLWVQRLTYKGLSDGAQFKTQRALREWVLSCLEWKGAQ